MPHLLYGALLAACLLGTAPLEIVLRVWVYRRWRRLVLALCPAFVLGVSWDSYAVHKHHWDFDNRYLLGAWIGNLPIEEIAFFLVIPICAVLTFEAVRRRRPDWIVGDELVAEQS